MSEFKIMGIGQGIMAELVIENGRITNNNPGDYKLPTCADIPKLKTVLVQSSGGVGALGAKPIGDFANNGPPAAIANAVPIYRALKANNVFAG